MASRVDLQGSEKKIPPSARPIGERPADEEIVVTMRVRRKKALPKTFSGTMTHQQYAEQYGASAEDLDKVVAFAKEHGLQVIERNAAMRKVAVRGTVADVEAAFHTSLKTYESAHGHRFRGREGTIRIPRELAKIVVGVFGLDNRTVAKPHYRVRHHSASPEVTTHAVHTHAFTPTALAHRYNFPKHLTGKGETVAIIELAGGFRPRELKTYFDSIGVHPTPKVTVAKFPGSGKNKPGKNPLDPKNCDLEVVLDIEVAAAVAPGAHFVVYFAPNASDHSFITVVAAAIHDTKHKPSILSISWGGPEVGGTEQFQSDMNDLLQEAAMLGITICVASGDNGSADYSAKDPDWDGRAHVDFPASSPFALACGGTHILPHDDSPNEVVWLSKKNEGTGGGISRVFALPSYQKSANVPKRRDPDGAIRRGVPDVAGNAAPESGYVVLCDGQHFPDHAKGIHPIGGTSAVAPLWAGLVALLNEGLGKRLGFLNPRLYQLRGSRAFADIRKGNNGAYYARKGWDPCTGLGVPDGEVLLKALKTSTATASKSRRARTVPTPASASKSRRSR